MKEKLRIAYIALIWAVCALVLFLTFGNYLTYCAFRLDYRTACWMMAYKHTTVSLLDLRIRK